MKKPRAACAALLLASGGLLAQAGPADFVLQDFIGHDWSSEAVRFEMPPAQAARASAGKALRMGDGTLVPYQLDGTGVVLLASLPAFATRELGFTEEVLAATTDVAIEETPDDIRLTNSRTGIALRRALAPGEGPLAGVRLGARRWVSDSRLSASPLVSYSARVVARGPVFAEVQGEAVLAGGGRWSMRVRLQAGEPVAVVEETFSAGDGATLELVLDRGFAPTALVHRRGKGTPERANAVGERIVTPLPTGDSEPAFMLEPWLHWWERDRQGTWFGLREGDAMLVVAAISPAEWIDPAVPAARRSPAQLQLRAQDGGYRLEMPLRGGKRRWLIGAAASTDDPQRWIVKHGDFPLDRVRALALRWPQRHAPGPRLFVGRRDIERLRALPPVPAATIARLARTPLTPPAMDEAVAAWLSSGDAPLGTHLATTAARWVREAVDRFLRQDSVVSLGFAPHQQWGLFTAANLADATDAALDPAARERIRAQLALLAYTLDRDDYWSPERGYAANPNMTTTVATLRVILAALLSDHPMAPAWAARGLRELKAELDDWSDERGGWLEAPHYALVSYDHLLGAFLAARNAGFGDHLHEPRMRMVARWMAQVSTPPDPAAQKRRTLLPIGNTYLQESTGEFGLLAYLWKDRDARFSAEMQWMHHEHGAPSAAGTGGFFATLAGYRRVLSDPTLAARAPRFESEWFPRTGVVLRTGFATPRETQLHMIAGSNHAHYDQDSGSITLWAKGRLVSGDFGYTGQAPAGEHSMVVTDAVPDAAVMQVVHFSRSELVDEVVGTKASAWTRRILLVKDEDPLGPNFVVLRDSLAPKARGTWRQWFVAAPTAAENGFVVRSGGDVETDVFFMTDMDAGVAEKTIASPGTFDGKFTRMPVTQASLWAPFEGSVGMVFFPRLAGEARPRVRRIADGRGLRIDSAHGTHYVFLADGPFAYQDADVAFSGTSAVAWKRADRVRLWLGASGTLTAFGERMRRP